MSRRSFLFNFIPIKKVGLEIGVWQGVFTKQIIKSAKPSQLHLVDPWIFERGMKKYFDGQEDLDKMYGVIYKRFENRSNIFVHRCTSIEFSHNVIDEFFDWIYIDGNHSFDGVYSDLVNFYPKVKKNGLIIGDDYGGKSKGVKKAVDQFCDERSIKFNQRKKQFWFEVKYDL